MDIKKLTRTSLLLALAVGSQFLKNLSVYITGPIVNCILIIALLTCGLASSVFLCLILPLTSWLITASPIISAMPVIMICIMIGNLTMVMCTQYFIRQKNTDKQLAVGLITGCIAKAGVMTVTISLLVLPLLGPSTGLPDKALAVAKLTFSVTQLITGLIGTVLTCALKRVLDKVAGKSN